MFDKMAKKIHLGDFVKKKIPVSRPRRGCTLRKKRFNVFAGV